MRLIVLVSVVTPLLLLLAAGGVSAQERRAAAATRAARGAHRAVVAPPVVETPPAPVLPGQAPWVRGVLIGVGAIVLAALVIGPLCRANMPDELPPTHSHDEPPGASHRHGPGGEDEGRRLKAEG